MKYILAVLAIISFGGFGLFTYFNDNLAVGGGTGTLNQLNQWRSDGTYITQNTASTSIKLTGYESSGNCLVTDSNGVVSTSTCGGGGSSKWTDGGTYIFPTAGESIEVTTIAATSTATSTFAGPITMAHPYYLTTHGLRGDASDGLYVIANNGTTVADFGVGNTANSSFLGAVNIDGATRLATSISGVLQATAGAVTATTTGTLTETVTGLQLDATRALIGGSAVLSLTSGYGIPLTASTTEWATAYASTTALTPAYIRGLFSNTATGLTYTAGTGATALTAGYVIPLSASTTEWTNFYNTPSTRITAGTGIDWSGNTLNGVYTAGDALTLTGEDFDFDGGATPQGELGGTWASPTIDDSLAVTNWNLTTPTLTSFFGTPCTGNQFLQDIGDTGTFSCAEAASGSSNWTLMSGGLRTSTSTDFARAAYFVATSTTATSTFPHLSISSTFTLFSNIYSTLAAFGTGVVQAITSVAPTGTWNFNGATVKQHTYKSFTWPGTATTTAATSTIPLGTAFTSEAWNSAECWVTNSTGAVIFTDGTNRMNGFTATTTAARTTLSVNNTFTASERRYVEIGILTGAQLSCTLDVTVNN